MSSEKGLASQFLKPVKIDNQASIKSSGSPRGDRASRVLAKRADRLVARDRSSGDNLIGNANALEATIKRRRGIGRRNGKLHVAEIVRIDGTVAEIPPIATGWPIRSEAEPIKERVRVEWRVSAARRRVLELPDVRQVRGLELEPRNVGTGRKHASVIEDHRERLPSAEVRELDREILSRREAGKRRVREQIHLAQIERG